MSSKVTKNMFRKGKQLLALLLTAVMTLGCFSSTAFAEMKPFVQREPPEAGDLQGEVRQTSDTISILPNRGGYLYIGDYISLQEYYSDSDEWNHSSTEWLAESGRLAFTWKKNGTALDTVKEQYELEVKEIGDYSCDVMVDGKLWTTISFKVIGPDDKSLVAGKSNQPVENKWYKFTVSKNAEYSFSIAKTTAYTELELRDEKKWLEDEDASTGESLSFERYLKAGVTYYLRCWADEKQSLSIEMTAAAKADQAVIDKAKAEAAAAKKAQAAAENAKKTAEAQAASTAVPAKLKVSVKAAKKALTVKWDKQTGVTGYEIQVATNKKFTKNLKTVKVKKAGAASKKIKKLKPKKKYFIRARAYKKISGGTILGAWSKAVKKKTK